MSKKLIYFVFGLGLIVTSAGNAADTDLVGWWKFDETSGTIAHDASGNGNDGTLKGDPMWVAGKVDGALQFDGDGDYVDVGSVGISGIDPRTIAGWVRASTTAIPSFTTVFGFAPDGSTDGTYFDIEVDNLGNYVVNVQGLQLVLSAVDTQWHHFAATYTGSGGSWYIDGRYIDSLEGAVGTIDQVRIGGKNTNFFPGLIDDVRIYNKALTVEEIKKVMAGPRAYEPTPADGTLYKDTLVSLGWLPGDAAVSHDVYFGGSFDDVDEGTEGTYYGNQSTLYFVAGIPGSSYPDGLVPGTTYYWRIDEVEADGTTVHKGDIWSFTVPSKSAYFPDPADGAKFIDPNADLSWTPGYEAKLHTVYFGDNFDDVNNAAGKLPEAAIGHSPGPLEPGKTYYWRVDEFDAVNTYKGAVWSFTTVGPGGGIRADYYRGMDLSVHALRRIDPQINFNWGDGGPDPLIGDNNFSVRWTAEVEAAFTERYTFYTNTDDGTRLWVDGKQLVNDWTNHGAEENSGTIDLVAGRFYTIVMEYYEDGGGAVAQLSWSSPHTPKQLIPQAALSPLIRAGSPNPSNGATDVKHARILMWTAGEHAVSHRIYFGFDEDALKNANMGSPEFIGLDELGAEGYNPGNLLWDTTYYWRIDEVNDANPDSPWIGSVWSFTTANFPVVDDFESYDVGNDEIWWAWKDGLGYAAHNNEPAYLGNGTGSAVGDETTASYTEETIVHGGRQSMPLSYDNNKQGYSNYSEVELTLSHPRDWTENEVNVLSLWFYGDPSNAPERMYVAITNSTGSSAIVYHDNDDAVAINTWTEWNIPLTEFSNQGVVLTDVDRIAIGLGTRGNIITPGGSGKMYFDDIRLYPPIEAAEQ